MLTTFGPLLDQCGTTCGPHLNQFWIMFGPSSALWLKITLALALLLRALLLVRALVLDQVPDLVLQQVHQGQQEQVQGRRVQQQGLRTLHPRVLDLVSQQLAADPICDAIGELCSTHEGAPDAWRWNTWYAPLAPNLPRRHLRHPLGR